jgi:tetratricopeptide (TPR) repeat protein
MAHRLGPEPFVASLGTVFRYDGDGDRVSVITDMGAEAEIPAPDLREFLEHLGAVGGGVEYAEVLDRAEETVARAEARVEMEKADAGDALAALLRLAPTDRVAAIEDEPRFRTYPLASLAIDASRKVAPSDPRRSRELADLARVVAAHLGFEPYGEERIQDLRAYAVATFGNSLRVAGDLRGAAQCFREARELLRSGTDASLELVEIDNLESSLRRDLHDFVSALDLSQRAIEGYHALGMKESVGKALLTQSTICDFMGDLAGNVAALERAANLVEREEDPWLALILRHNLIFGLARDRQFQRARTLLGETEDLYRQVTVPAMWARRHWVEGLIREGEENLAGAIGQLEAARDRFAEHGFFFDAALVSLDLAAVLLAEGHTPEVKAVAAAAYALLEGQGVHPDALAALSQFQQAAAMERLDREILREIALRLSRAAEFRPLPA